MKIPKNFNIEIDGFFYAWSHVNKKRIDEPHRPTEKVFIISWNSLLVKVFMHCDFIEWANVK